MLTRLEVASGHLKEKTKRMDDHEYDTSIFIQRNKESKQDKDDGR